MCEFGVSELQFELVVLISLSNCIVGRETMTATHESPFFILNKKNKKIKTL